MSEEIKRKRGRPPKDGVTKSARIESRVTDETKSKLEYLCNKKGMSQSSMLEDLINNRYNIMKVLGDDDNL